MCGVCGFRVVRDERYCRLGGYPTGSHKAGFLVRIQGLQLSRGEALSQGLAAGTGWAGLAGLSRLGTQIGKAGGSRARRLRVRIPPQPLSGRVVQWQDAGVTYRKRRFNSFRDHSVRVAVTLRPRSAARGSVVQWQGASVTCWKGGFDSPRNHAPREAFLGSRREGHPPGGLPRGQGVVRGAGRGLLVQRKDAWVASRRSGFNSPAVHRGVDGTSRERRGAAGAGSWSNGKTPPWRGGESGSIPGGSIRKLEGSRIRLAGPRC